MDLHRIVDVAGDAASGHRAQRDRALAALHCFSGLRPEEIIELQWEDLGADLTTVGRYGMTAAVGRDGRRLARRNSTQRLKGDPHGREDDYDQGYR